MTKTKMVSVGGSCFMINFIFKFSAAGEWYPIVNALSYKIALSETRYDFS